MKHFILCLIVLMGTLLPSCQNTNPPSQPKVVAKTFQNKAHELVDKMVQKVGTYESLSKKKDVVYTYTYQTPDGKMDVSTEKYIFDGELSLGVYQKHERTVPQLDGVIEQGYNGEGFWLKHKGEYLEDNELLKKVTFNRKTNFYWFAMLPKLLDPGLNYEYIKEETIDNNKYDVVKVGFKSNNGKPTDVYQLYINQKTSLVDQFLFTVVDFNVVENPMLMRMEYEEIDGLLIPSKRKYKKSTWNADVDEKPWIAVTWSDIKFDNNLMKGEFDKK